MGWGGCCCLSLPVEPPEGFYDGRLTQTKQSGFQTGQRGAEKGAARRPGHSSRRWSPVTGCWVSRFFKVVSHDGGREGDHPGQFWLLQLCLRVHGDQQSASPAITGLGLGFFLPWFPLFGSRVAFERRNWLPAFKYAPKPDTNDTKPNPSGATETRRFACLDSFSRRTRTFPLSSNFCTFNLRSRCSFFCP